MKTFSSITKYENIFKYVFNKVYFFVKNRLDGPLSFAQQDPLHEKCISTIYVIAIQPKNRQKIMTTGI
jgi:hypothetical protein